MSEITLQFTEKEVNSEMYRFRAPFQNRKRNVLVHIFSKTQGPTENSGKSKKEDIDVDAYKLKTFFKEKFQLKDKHVNVHCNKTVAEVDTILADISKKENIDTKDHDVFFFVFLTYLKNGQLQFHGENAALDIFLKKISEMKYLLMKPKIVIVQADDLQLVHPEVVTKDGPSDVKEIKIPTDADRLVLFSTIPQFFANLPMEKSDEARKAEGIGSSHKNSSSSQPTKARPPRDEIEESRKQLEGTNLSEQSQVVVHPSNIESVVNQEAEARCSWMIQAVIDVLNDPSNSNVDFLSLTPQINAKVEGEIEE